MVDVVTTWPAGALHGRPSAGASARDVLHAKGRSSAVQESRVTPGTPLMKPTDIEKLQAMKTVGAMKREPTSDRYGANAGAPGDKREQREKDKAAGLVPFAVKLPQDLRHVAPGAGAGKGDDAERADRGSAAQGDEGEEVAEASAWRRRSPEPRHLVRVYYADILREWRQP